MRWCLYDFKINMFISGLVIYSTVVVFDCWNLKFPNDSAHASLNLYQHVQNIIRQKRNNFSYNENILVEIFSNNKSIRKIVMPNQQWRRFHQESFLFAWNLHNETYISTLRFGFKKTSFEIMFANCAILDIFRTFIKFVSSPLAETLFQSILSSDHQICITKFSTMAAKSYGFH